MGEERRLIVHAPNAAYVNQRSRGPVPDGADGFYIAMRLWRFISLPA
jgi:hypothetical protein